MADEIVYKKITRKADKGLEGKMLPSMASRPTKS